MDSSPTISSKKLLTIDKINVFLFGKYNLVLYFCTVNNIKIMNKIEKAILIELKQWDLSCCEQASFKTELAKSIADVVKKCTVKSQTKRNK